MKFSKKLMSLLLSAFMMLTMAIPSFAAENPSITIQNNNKENVTIIGHTYYAYKVMDLKSSAGDNYAYTVAPKFKSFFDDVLQKEDWTDKDAVKYLNDTYNTPALYNDLATALAEFISNDTSPVDADASATATAEAVTIPLTDYGYYIVLDGGYDAESSGDPTYKVISALMLTHANPTKDVVIKAEVPHIEKKILDDNKYGDETYNYDYDPNVEGNDRVIVDSNSAAIGDTVTYRLTSNVPTEMTGYNKYLFKMVDTLSEGLSLAENFSDANVKITIKGATGINGLTNDVLTDKLYDVTVADDGQSFTIDFIDFINYKDIEDIENAEIEVIYSVTINDKAKIGAEGNPNTVRLEYSNNPTHEYGGTNDDDYMGHTPDDTVITYLTGLQIFKYAEVNGERIGLNGAQFKIEAKDLLNKAYAHGNRFVKAENGDYAKIDDAYVKWDSLTTDKQTAYTGDRYNEVPFEENMTYAFGDFEAIATVDIDGYLTFSGLAAGTYTITELVAPDGYNKLDNPITVVIDFTRATDPNRNTQHIWTAKSGEQNLDLVDDKFTSSNKAFELAVLNESGTKLPETGGMGTRVFVISGIVLMLGAAVLLITKRKVSAQG